MKICPNCKEEKLLSEYWKNQSSCIDCVKFKQKNRWHSRTPKKRLEQHLKYKYGLTPNEVQEAWNKQDGKCAICNIDLPDLMVYESRRRGYAIDHNHDTGEFRSILCLNCNSLLGMSGDNPDILEKATKYLKTRGHYSVVSLEKVGTQNV